MSPDSIIAIVFGLLGTIVGLVSILIAYFTLRATRFGNGILILPFLPTRDVLLSVC
ncbi:hypothetical protein BDZ45DRAFT_678587, partial [Acephala macrosclerotiorum]